MLSLACNLGLLGSFKYFNFLSESFALLANSLHWHVDDLTLKVVLPVGISFYTFQTLSYTIDIGVCSTTWPSVHFFPSS